MNKSTDNPCGILRSGIWLYVICFDWHSTSLCILFYIFRLFKSAVIKLVKNGKLHIPLLIPLLICGWCSFDRCIFCIRFGHGLRAVSVMQCAVSRCGLICWDTNASLMGSQLTWPPSLLLNLFPSFLPLQHSTVSPVSSHYFSIFYTPHVVFLTLPPLHHHAFHFFLLNVFPSCSLLSHSLSFFQFLCHPPPHSFCSPALHHCLSCSFTLFLLHRMKPVHGEHDKQAPFHWIPGVTVTSYFYQHGNAAF